VTSAYPITTSIVVLLWLDNKLIWDCLVLKIFLIGTRTLHAGSIHPFVFFQVYTNTVSFSSIFTETYVELLIYKSLFPSV